MGLSNVLSQIIWPIVKSQQMATNFKNRNITHLYCPFRDARNVRVAKIQNEKVLSIVGRILRCYDNIQTNTTN